MKKINYDQIVYIDTGFIASKYEEICNIHPDTEFTKVEGKKADASITLLSAGVHTQETRKFKLSSFKMVKKIEKELFSYPALSKNKGLDLNKNSTIWVSGILSVSEWIDQKTKEVDGFPYFYIGDEDDDHFPIITEPENFYCGINKLLYLSTPFQINMGFRVSALIRVFYYSEHKYKYYISYPYLIYEDKFS